MKQTFSFTAMLKRITLLLHVSRRRWLIGLPTFSLIVTLFSLLCLPDTIPVHYDSA